MTDTSHDIVTNTPGQSTERVWPPLPTCAPMIWEAEGVTVISNNQRIVIKFNTIREWELIRRRIIFGSVPVVVIFAGCVNLAERNIHPNRNLFLCLFIMISQGIMSWFLSRYFATREHFVLDRTAGILTNQSGANINPLNNFTTIHIGASKHRSQLHEVSLRIEGSVANKLSWRLKGYHKFSGGWAYPLAGFHEKTNADAMAVLLAEFLGYHVSSLDTQP